MTLGAVETGLKTGEFLMAGRGDPKADGAWLEEGNSLLCVPHSNNQTLCRSLCKIQTTTSNMQE